MSAHADDDSGDITSSRSILNGIAISLTIGFLVMLLALYWVSILESVLISKLVAIGAIFGVLAYLFPVGLQKGHVPVFARGVGLTNGTPNGKIYAHGDHWIFFVTDEVSPVDVRAVRIDPPDVSVLAGTLDIKVDAFALAHVSAPLLYFQTEEPEEVIRKELVSAIRLFVSQWDDVIIAKQKNLLGDYLALNERNSAEGRKVEDALRRLEKMPDTRALSDKAVEAIMENAGKFVDELAERGYALDEVRVEDITLPPEITNARADELAFESVMRKKLRAAQNLGEIVKTIRTEAPNARDSDILDTASMIAALDVKKVVTSFSSEDIKAVGKHLGEGFAKIAEAFAERFGKEGG